jgi:hypothetical protein
MPIASSWHQNICIDRGTLMKHHSYRFNFHSSEVLRNHPYLHHYFFFFFEAQNCIPLHTVQSIVKWNLQMTLTMVGHGSQHPNSWHLTKSARNWGGSLPWIIRAWQTPSKFWSWVSLSMTRKYESSGHEQPKSTRKKRIEVSKTKELINIYWGDFREKVRPQQAGTSKRGRYH